MLSWVASILAGSVAVVYLLLKKYPWLPYDFRFIRSLGGTLITYNSYVRKKLLLVDIFEKKAKEFPKKPFLVYHGEKFSYEFVDKQANKVARVACKLGIKNGETVSVMMLNEPIFVALYLGFVKAGVQPAFINTNLRSKSLLHCINVAGAKLIIVGNDHQMLDALQEIQEDLTSQGTSIYVSGSGKDESILPQGFKSLELLVESVSDDSIDKSVRSSVKLHDPMCYIFTSGTTGLPKAAIVSHAKSLKATSFFQCANGNAEDVVYTPLPLYHSAALCVGLGSVIHMGASMVLRPKFSATHYWEDCRKYDVTITQYIGELCRYLLARPPSPDDRNHKVRACVGNGLRKDIWKEFQERFRVPLIVEFYAATEGNAGFINFFNKVGAVGRASPFLQLLYPTYFIKYDYETAEPVRDKSGHCIRVKPGEPGMMISRIKRDMEYEGYKGNTKLTENKLVRNVYKTGDVYFNTGDLFIMDKDYFLYFNDRIGDTFRWKGENVSTIEVSNLVSDIPWIEDANVYGVEVSGNDGRAGMTALLLRKGEQLTDVRLQELYQKCEELLPAYARPRFLRLQQELEVTGTLKHRKVELVKEGFDPTKCQGEPLYCMDAKSKTYIPLDGQVYQGILDGKIRL